MIPKYIAYLHDDQKPQAKIIIKAWTFEGAQRKAREYFKPQNLLDIIVRKI